jgi:2-oxoisovalerate ferredoxin oxidoreductase alpha subunit
LKCEGISYLAGVQLPAVVVDIMRAGPGLGNIGPEQGDYNQVVKGGGHGNYRNIVLAPNSVQEMCDFTMRAFDLAHQYRMTAFVLADGVLGQMIEPLRFPEHSVAPVTDTSWAVDGTAATRPNVVTSIFLDFDQLEEFNYKLQEKYAALEAAEQDCETYRLEDADIALVAYGIIARIAQGAVDAARREGLRVGLLRPKAALSVPQDRHPGIRRPRAASRSSAWS